MSSLSAEQFVGWGGEAVAAVGIALVALAARLGVVAALPVSTPVSDMQDYWERAVYIADHGQLYANSWRMPGYPAALALSSALASGLSLESARRFDIVTAVSRRFSLLERR